MTTVVGFVTGVGVGILAALAGTMVWPADKPPKMSGVLAAPPRQPAASRLEILSGQIANVPSIVLDSTGHVICSDEKPEAPLNKLIKRFDQHVGPVGEP